ncbi:MAG: hypothetical protein ACJAZ2_001280, partial [Glaciecola sp.]
NINYLKPRKYDETTKRKRTAEFQSIEYMKK